MPIRDAAESTTNVVVNRLLSTCLIPPCSQGAREMKERLRLTQFYITTLLPTTSISMSRKYITSTERLANYLWITESPASSASQTADIRTRDSVIVSSRQNLPEWRITSITSNMNNDANLHHKRRLCQHRFLPVAQSTRCQCKLGLKTSQCHHHQASINQSFIFRQKCGGDEKSNQLLLTRTNKRGKSNKADKA